MGKSPIWGLSLSALCLYTCTFWSQWNLAAGEGSKNETNSERYPLMVFDFERIELPLVICLWVLIASLAKIAFHLHSKLPTICPESCLLVVLGLLLGCLLHFTGVATKSEYVLSAHVFFIYLLPPIIFDAGYFMPIRPFFDNIGSVLLLAFVNTAINTAAIGFSLWAVSYWGWIGRDISLLHCLIFSALISAVDPVAVISVFEEVHVNHMLYILVFGESLLNDGVTVVLYHMMEGFIELGEENIIAVDVVTGIGSFFIIALGGSLIGIFYGFFGGFVTKFTSHVKVIEPLFVFVMGYLMYLTSEMMHLSGILALSFGGIVLRHYIEHNVSKSTATTIKYFMKMLTNISETIIFMFLGLSTIVDTLDWNLGFIFFALLFCLIYRVLGVTVLSWFLNRRRLVPLTKIDQFIMAYGGLRGGIAFCLALSLDEKLVPEKRLFVTATIIIVFFTVFVQGITVKPVVNALKVKKQTSETPTLNQKIHETMLDHLMAGIEDLTSRSSHNLMRTKFRRFNHKYIQPLLGKEKAKVKSSKIINIYDTLNEQDALKTTTAKTPTTVGSSADLYEDHKRALIQGSPLNAAGDQDDTITLQRALRAGKPGAKWSINRRHTIGDSLESVDRVVYHRSTSRNHLAPPPSQAQPSLTNGRAVMKDLGRQNRLGSHSGSTSSFEGVTINFNPTGKDDSETVSIEENHIIPSPIEETMAEKMLPWKETSSENPSPTHLDDTIPNNEPIIAHVPSWVDNLAYSHITETGSPYVSPQTTVIPNKTENHRPIFSIFPIQPDEIESSLKKVSTDDNFPNPWSIKRVSTDDNFPNPWGQSDTLEDCPLVSPMVGESSERTDELLHSTHLDKAPAHHHVIVPSNHHIDSDQSSCKHLTHLSEVASAPDIQHWKPIQKPGFCHPVTKLQSDTMLVELALQEGMKNRVQEWLKLADDEDANDADGEGNESGDGLDDAENLELELDKQMNER